VKGERAMDWRDLMKYPELIPQVNGEHEDMMDAMQELIPLHQEAGDGRIDTFILWVADCKDQGVITLVEKMNLQHYLIHTYGGF
jgi:hypothetical protein